MTEQELMAAMHPIAVARDEWLRSSDGSACQSRLPAVGWRPYLTNRLVTAFLAGAEAGEAQRPALTDEQVRLIASRIACDMAGQIDWDTLEDKRSNIDMMTAAGEAAIREAIGRGERG